MNPILKAVSNLLFALVLCSSARGERTAQPEAEIPEEQGTASYYGEKFRNKPTASGEKFNPQDLTAAHPSLPLGAKVKVKNRQTGKQVKVRINDRGPNVPGRNIDLSEKAAERIGVKESGTAPVEVKGADEKTDPELSTGK